MKNNMKKLIAWTAALFLVFQILPMTVLAEDVQSGQAVGLPGLGTLEASKSQPVYLADKAQVTIAYKQGTKTVEFTADTDPNKAYTMSFTAAGINTDTIADEQEMRYPAENAVITDGSNETVSWRYDSATKEIVFTWNGTRAETFSAEIGCTPNLPGTLNLDGSYIVVSVKSDNTLIGMMTTEIDSANKRLKTKSIRKYGETQVYLDNQEAVFWTFTRVSGDWYTISCGDQYLHMDGNALTLTDGTNPQKFRISTTASDKDSSVTGYRIDYGDKYVLNTKGANVNNGMQGSAYYDQVIRLFSRKQFLDPKSTTMGYISYNVNGGKGEVPEIRMADVGEEIVLGECAATKADAVFLGWAEVSNILAKINNQYTMVRYYVPGETYTVQKTGVTTLYAVWASTKPQECKFGIFKGNGIPDEPANYPTENYTQINSARYYPNSIVTGQWIIDQDTSKKAEEGNYYISNNVTAALRVMPTLEEIQAAVPSFDPETMHVLWYVAKNMGKWHVDGVIIEDAKLAVVYDANMPESEKQNNDTTLLGFQTEPGTQITVGASGGHTVTEPSRPGYVFLGWNTERDGSGTYYNTNATQLITENMTFYAQWAREDELHIRITSDWPKGQMGYVGAQITLTATLTGFENYQYILQWQYTEDGNTWYDISGANEITYTYTLDEKTTNYNWRIVARDVH